MIAIIDYGRGNLYSVEKAFHMLGAKAVVTRDAEVIRAADKVVLPGVGAFGDGRDGAVVLADLVGDAIGTDAVQFARQDHRDRRSAHGVEFGRRIGDLRPYLPGKTAAVWPACRTANRWPPAGRCWC